MIFTDSDTLIGVHKESLTHEGSIVALRTHINKEDQSEGEKTQLRHFCTTETTSGAVHNRPRPS